MFEKIIDALRNPVEGVDLGGLADELVAESATLASGYQAAIAQRDTSLADLAVERAALQAHNYELMMKTATADQIEPNENLDDDSQLRGIDDLFR